MVLEREGKTRKGVPARLRGRTLFRRLHQILRELLRFRRQRAGAFEFSRGNGSPRLIDELVNLVDYILLIGIQLLST